MGRQRDHRSSALPGRQLTELKQTMARTTTIRRRHFDWNILSVLNKLFVEETVRSFFDRDFRFSVAPEFWFGHFFFSFTGLDFQNWFSWLLRNKLVSKVFCCRQRRRRRRRRRCFDYDFGASTHREFEITPVTWNNKNAFQCWLQQMSWFQGLCLVKYWQ